MRFSTIGAVSLVLPSTFAALFDNQTCSGCIVHGGGEGMYVWAPPEYYVNETVHVFLDPTDNSTISTSVESNTDASASYTSVCASATSSLGAKDQYYWDCDPHTSVELSTSFPFGGGFTGTLT